MTEIRGPYYTPMGPRYREDVLETMGAYVDALKFAGGSSSQAELAAEDTRDPEWLIQQGRRFLDAGAELLMIESEGITEQVEQWRTDVIARVATALGLERVMFEAADPAVFAWYIKTYGPDVNLFVDHSQIVQLECLRAGIWGPKDLWDRVRTFKE